MNLRVDLILESEQRSGSIINPKSLLRIATIIVPAILGVVAAIVVVNMLRVNSELNLLEAQMQAFVPKEKTAEKVKAQVGVNRNILVEMESWRKTQLTWHDQFLALQKAVPDEIQLNTLGMSHSIERGEDDTVPSRVFRMILTGKAAGERAEKNVQHLREQLAKTPVFSAPMKNVDVTKFISDPDKEAQKMDRIFEIQCHYQPRKFE